MLGSIPPLRTFFRNLAPPSLSLPSGVKNLFHCLGRRACFLLLRDQGDLRVPRSVGIGEDDDDDCDCDCDDDGDDDDDDDEATTNKTDLK